MATRDEAQLISRAKKGVPAAIDQVFRRYGPRLLALIRLRLGPQLRPLVDPGDIMQDTLLKAFRHFDEFDGSSENSLMAWLGAIARNQIVDEARRQGRQCRDMRRAVPLDDVAEPVAEQVRSEVSRIHLTAQATRLEAALESLSEAHREVILLRRFEGLPFAQIGERLSKSPDACRMLYARAMTALTLKMRPVA